MSEYRIFSGSGQSAGGPRWLRAGSLWIYRALTYAVLAAGLAFAAAVIGLRYFVLPNIERYREPIAAAVSELARQRITIGALHASWEGLRPRLVLERVTVHDRAGKPALELSRVDSTLSWWSLVALRPRFQAIDIYGPALEIRRSAQGAISVAGIELSAEGGSGFVDWLLGQRDIEVHDATVAWTDEQRAAPRLELRGVNLHIANRGSRHRFGLRAVPPPELAGALDLRGDLTGASVAAIAEWSGRLFVQLDYADLAGWRPWIALPFELASGAGALRAWASFDRGTASELLADVRLAGVRARLAPELPVLDLAELAGRVGWKQSGDGFELSTRRLALATADGLALPPADFLLRVSAAAGRRPARGELQADALELAPLAALADHLPLPQEVRARLAALAPRGALYDLAARWSGDWRTPERYSVRGRFSGLGLNRIGRLPGFSGAGGSLDANERGGTLHLNAQKARLEMPLVFRDAHEFDTFTAQVSWSRSGGETEIRLNSVAFSNAHVAGNVFGIYRTAGDTRGFIDLTGALTRADARYVGRYVPLVIAKGTREWLDSAFGSGHSNEVTLRLKGNLDAFPFPGGEGGVFQVTAKVSGGTLRYAPGWPQIENIAGDLVFRGKRMDVYARSGTILGARLSRVRAEIPDLLTDREVLHVAGEAEGPTSEFLAFIEKSPVLGMIDRFTEGWSVQGTGRLALKLTIPLREPERSRVSGVFRFTNNTVAWDPDLPPVEQASGTIEFTESSVRAQAVKGVLLGGPVAIETAPQRDGAVRVSVQGKIDAEALRRAPGAPAWAQHLRGATDWRASLALRRGDFDYTIESSLQGLTVDLPAPLVKTAAEALPLRFERRAAGGGQDRLQLDLGEIASARLVRRVEEGRARIARGAVRLGGGAAPEPERSGVWVSGELKALDLDRWAALWRDRGRGADFELAGLELKLGGMRALGRAFGGLAVSLRKQGREYRGTLSGAELEGTVVWDPQGRGRILARMKMFALPPAATGGAGAGRGAVEEQEVPALDLAAEQFVKDGRSFGRLELVGAPEARGWRIEKLRIANPEGSLALEGLWGGAGAQATTQVQLRLDTSDIGRLLARLGYPEGVKRGTARLEGTLAWRGAPWEFDYGTLSGRLVLDAAKGQFVKLEPGLGKLLGILSLQALPRRIALDFRDVFSEGFAFDEIVGSARIEKGVATTESLRMRGPSARIAMSGEVDLARETQNLRVRITPHVSDSVSIAGALIGGPVAGVAAFLAQKVLKDPLDELVSYEYQVTGSWSEPTVTRIAPQAAQPEAGKGSQ